MKTRNLKDQVKTLTADNSRKEEEIQRMRRQIEALTGKAQVPQSRAATKATVNTAPAKGPKYKKVKTALKGTTKSFRVEVVSADPLVQSKDSRGTVATIVERELKNMEGLKLYETLEVRMIKDSVETDGTTETKSEVFHFNTPTVTITNASTSALVLEETTAALESRLQSFQERGSNWKISDILGHYVNVVSYSPLKGSSYLELPECLTLGKTGLINPKNKDNKCLLWCHTTHINPQTNNPQRIKKEDRKLAETLNYTGIEFPVKITDIGKIETQNNIRISVFGHSGGKKF